MMKQPDSACKNIDMHRTCYATLFKYLMDKGIPFSMDAALDWLEIKKREISYETCSQYRNALFRLEHYLLFGDIKSSFCRSEDSFFCRRKCQVFLQHFFKKIFNIVYLLFIIYNDIIRLQLQLFLSSFLKKCIEKRLSSGSHFLYAPLSFILLIFPFH